MFRLTLQTTKGRECAAEVIGDLSAERWQDNLKDCAPLWFWKAWSWSQPWKKRGVLSLSPRGIVRGFGPLLWAADRPGQRTPPISTFPAFLRAIAAFWFSRLYFLAWRQDYLPTSEGLILLFFFFFSLPLKKGMCPWAFLPLFTPLESNFKKRNLLNTHYSQQCR